MDAGTDASTIGPIQLIAVGFEPGVGFVGTIIEDIDRLQGHGVHRLVDLVVLTMDDDGSLTRVEIADEDFGDVLIADAPLDSAAERFSMLFGSPRFGGFALSRDDHVGDTEVVSWHCQVEQSDQDLRRCVLVNPQVICDA